MHFLLKLLFFTTKFESSSFCFTNQSPFSVLVVLVLLCFERGWICSTPVRSWSHRHYSRNRATAMETLGIGLDENVGICRCQTHTETQSDETSPPNVYDLKLSMQGFCCQTVIFMQPQPPIFRMFSHQANMKDVGIRQTTCPQLMWTLYSYILYSVKYRPMLIICSGQTLALSRWSSFCGLNALPRRQLMPRRQFKFNLTDLLESAVEVNYRESRIH
jgi:hypothetical protein